MNIASKKLKSGFEMPVFGIGTWQVGGRFETDTSEDKKHIEALRRAIEFGITHIDSAEVYGNGHAEELVAQATKGYDRSKLFLVSKVFTNRLKHDDVLNSCAASLKRLQTDYLDLYLIHAPNPEVPLEETLTALQELKQDGKIRNIGVSNFNIDQTEEAQKLTNNTIVVNQIRYNIAYQEWSDVVGYCQRNDIFITAYRPVERGVLSKTGIPILDEMCQKYKKTPAQIVINWLISQDNVVTIAKMSTLDHLKENLGALDWQMEKEDVEKLRSEFPEVELPQSTAKFNK